MQAVPNPQGDERKPRAGSAASSRRAILQLSAAGTSTALTAHGLQAAEADHRPANDIPDRPRCLAPRCGSTHWILPIWPRSGRSVPACARPARASMP